MNKDKIIKDLKERNVKLKIQNELKDIRCCHLEQELAKLKKQLEDRTKYIFVTKCSSEQNSYFMPLEEYLDMNELPKNYEDYEYLELTDNEVIYLEDYIRDLKITDMKKKLDLRKYYKIRDMFESGVVDLGELKNIVLGDDK